MLRQIIDEVMFEIRKLSGQDYVDDYAGKAETETAEAACRAETSGNGHTAPIEVAEPAREPARERVLVGAAGAEDLEVHHDVEERRSSADVLSKWWS